MEIFKDLIGRFYHGKYKYFLKRDLVVELQELSNLSVISDFVSIHNQHIILKMGYAWDGASGGIDTENFLIPSAVHDSLYQLIQLGLISAEKRILADKILYKLCLEYGMSKIRAKVVYLAVRSFGWLHCKPQSKEV